MPINTTDIRSILILPVFLLVNACTTAIAVKSDVDAVAILSCTTYDNSLRTVESLAAVFDSNQARGY